MTSSSVGQTEFIIADVQQPEKILADPALPRTLDLDQPVALLLVAILMYFPTTKTHRAWSPRCSTACPLAATSWSRIPVATSTRRR